MNLQNYLKPNEPLLDKAAHKINQMTWTVIEENKKFIRSHQILSK